MKFYDLHIHGDESSIKEIAVMAKELGYAGICFVIYFHQIKELERIRFEIEKTKKDVGIEIFLGLEAKNIKELNSLVRMEKDFNVLLASGGELEMNRKAVETQGINILAHPELERIDSGINHTLAKLAMKNGVAIEINFREVFSASKRKKSKILSNMEFNVKLAKKYGTKIILTSGAFSSFEMKDPYSLISFGSLLGLTLKEAKETISKTPEEILKKMEERKNKNFIMPGVRIR